MQEEPIVALSTPPGVSGIAVIRVSGEKSIGIVNHVFDGKNLEKQKSHTLHYGTIRDSDRIIDTVVVSLFNAPNSYTGEDVAEISCHGGPFVYEKIIELIASNGARNAEPGEFSKRAFINGKLDLAQAEAVADLIHSSSYAGALTSARQLEGGFTWRLNNFNESLKETAGLLELELDFSQEDIELIKKETLVSKIIEVINYCRELYSSYKSAEILRSGYFIAIAGYPNSGKSTLFNTLLRRNRAIVSEIPGTTRDYLEERILLDGITVHLTDTAGLREAEDVIEVEGIKMVESVLNQSNMILVLNDASISLDYSDHLYEELSGNFSETQIHLVHNKCDLIDFSGEDLFISAKTGYGIDKIKTLITDDAQKNSSRINDILVNQRHYNLLREAEKSLVAALDSIHAGMENELIAIDIRNAIHLFGDLTGVNWNEEILNTIFKGFCIGK